MEFRLTYNGPLRSNGGIQEKQDIRRHFHSQLKVLWQQRPLNSMAKLLAKDPWKGKFTVIRELGGFRFANLVCEQLRLIAELDIILLKPEPPGHVITHAGDIDNRLKTLFDALRMPKGANEIPAGDKPREEEAPFFCLLEDDNLITRVAVTTDRLLASGRDSAHVSMVIHVTTKITEMLLGNTGLG